ncbi:MAG: Rpn family recombination-promoting nuclease/putative transposase [Proteobacteria bacterium]|nr:Rpn family recombination-promoting nuclease/putative transposase [Pseudomonadota bacterium]
MNKKCLSPHDRYIRSIMTHTKVAREFFEHHLPEKIAKAINFTSLKAQKDSFVDDKLRLQIADLLYSVEFHGEPGYLYLLLEHASTPDKLLPYRMLKYTISVIESHLKKTGNSNLPFVYPLILYSGSKPFSYSTDFFDLFGKEKDLARAVFLSPCQLIDLTKVPDETLRDFFWFGAAALIAKHIHDPDILPILTTVLQLLKRIEKEGNIDYLYVTLSYIIEAGEIKDKEAFIETVKSNLSEVNEEKIMTLADQWKQEGYQKGIEIGTEKGKKEEKIEIARAMLSKGLGLDVISSVTALRSDEVKKLMA